MVKKLKVETPPVAQALPGDSKVKDDILKMEYESLLSLYTHTENTISNVFNFYLTLLSAIAGAMIVLVQLNGVNLVATLPSLTAVLVFVILVGIITQDSIVNKNIELTNYTLGLNLLKYRLFQSWPEEKSYVFYLHNFFADVSPLPSKRHGTVTQIHRRFWWLFSLGTHQLFIGVINSLALAALLLIATYLLSGNAIPIERLVIGSIVVVVFSFEIHAIYARTKHRRGVKNFITAAGTEVPWGKGAG